jgi:queuosine precursor transporter
MHRFRLYGILVGVMVSLMLTCDALAFKIIEIHGYKFSASGLIFPINFMLAAVMTDSYGYDLAGRIIWIQLISQLIFIMTVNLFVLLPSSSVDPISVLYASLYSNIWRVLIASSLAIFLAYFLNDFIMSKLKIYYMGNLFIIRFLLSNAVGKAALVCISYPINLYGIYSPIEITHIAFNTWVYKMIMALILFPIAIGLSCFIKKIEKTDYYDFGISYNPMRVFSIKNHGKNKYGS